LPEIHNPDFESRNPGGNGDVRSLLALTMLVFVLFFGFQYVRQPKPSVHSPASQVQSQRLKRQSPTRRRQRLLISLLHPLAALGGKHS
jgi:hypothetical protein